MNPALPPEIADKAAEHLEKLTIGKDLVAARQVHPASPEGKIFTIVLEALEFVVGLFHHAAKQPAETTAAIPTTTTPAAETEKV